MNPDQRVRRDQRTAEESKREHRPRAWINQAMVSISVQHAAWNSLSPWRLLR